MIGPRLLRLRSDEQLVALFRAGHDEAFQVIYDRYHKRLESYARQMLPRGCDAEDVLQDVFVRAYRALQTSDRELAVRPWLFRIVHNRCIDEIRRGIPTPTDELASLPSHTDDPAAQIDAREALRRLIKDIERLPEQQRSALLLRELAGISYTEVASVLDTTVPAVKSLLVRARMGLVQASTARDTACSEIREELTLAHDQGVRAGPTVRRHLRDCPGCRSYRGQVFLVKKRLAALAPAGPLAGLGRLIGLPGGATGTGGGAAALGTGGTATGAVIGVNHVAALIAAAVASAGGGIGLHHLIASGTHPQHAITHRQHGPAVGQANTSAVMGAGSAIEPGGSMIGAGLRTPGDLGGGAGGQGSRSGSGTGAATGAFTPSSPVPSLPGSGTAGDQTGSPPNVSSDGTGTGTATGSTTPTGPPPQTRPGPTTDPSAGSTGTDVGGTTGPPPTATGSSGSGSSTGDGSTGGTTTGTTNTGDPGTTTGSTGDGSSSGPTPTSPSSSASTS